jgi:hypothetical protein
VNPYDDLVELAVLEAELIAAGEWVEVVGLDARRRELVGRLPAEPPAEAREALERAEAQLRRNAGAIAASLAETRGALEALAGRRAVLGPYAPAQGPRLELKA